MDESNAKDVAEVMEAIKRGLHPEMTGHYEVEGQTAAPEEPAPPADIGPKVQLAVAAVMAALEPLDDDARCRVIAAARVLCDVPTEGMRMFGDIMQSVSKASPLFLSMLDQYKKHTADMFSSPIPMYETYNPHMTAAPPDDEQPGEAVAP